VGTHGLNRVAQGQTADGACLEDPDDLLEQLAPRDIAELWRCEKRRRTLAAQPNDSSTSRNAERLTASPATCRIRARDGVEYEQPTPTVRAKGANDGPLRALQLQW
jgi:hypothetical protein